MEKFETKIQNENNFPITTATSLNQLAVKNSATGLVLGPRTNIQMVLPYLAIDSVTPSKANNTSGSPKSVMTNNTLSHPNHTAKTESSGLILTNLKQTFVNKLNQVNFSKLLVKNDFILMKLSKFKGY